MTAQKLDELEERTAIVEETIAAWRRADERMRAQAQALALDGVTPYRLLEEGEEGEHVDPTAEQVHLQVARVLERLPLRALDLWLDCDTWLEHGR